MIPFSSFDHFILTHTLVASMAAVYENLSGDLQKQKYLIYMVMSVYDSTILM